jgi:hypothetical protein
MEYTYKTRQLTIKCNLNDKHKIIPFGDVHRDTQGCDVDRWEWFLKNSRATLESNPSTYFMCMGDTHDFGSFSEVKKIKSSVLHQTTMEKFDMMAQEDNRKFCQEIGFMRGKMLGFIEGNHGWVMSDGKTANEDLAERLGSESLGWLCHYTLNFQFEDRSKGSQNVYIVACHGKAGGKTAGNSVNQVDWLRNVFPAADIYIMGHDHERWIRPVNVLLPNPSAGGVKIKQKRQLLCRSGSYLKGYHDGASSYTVAGLFRPSDLGSIQIDISFHRDQSGGEDRIITDIHGIV